jgi:hypothetical protein
MILGTTVVDDTSILSIIGLSTKIKGLFPLNCFTLIMGSMVTMFYCEYFNINVFNIKMNKKYTFIFI